MQVNQPSLSGPRPFGLARAIPKAVRLALAVALTLAGGFVHAQSPKPASPAPGQAAPTQAAPAQVAPIQPAPVQAAPGPGSARPVVEAAPQAVPGFWDPRRRPDRPDLSRITVIRFLTQASMSIWRG
jgi:polar amino acid transport system substrate-binding protein